MGDFDEEVTQQEVANALREAPRLRADFESVEDRLAARWRSFDGGALEEATEVPTAARDVVASARHLEYVLMEVERQPARSPASLQRPWRASPPSSRTRGGAPRPSTASSVPWRRRCCATLENDLGGALNQVRRVCVERTSD